MTERDLNYYLACEKGARDNLASILKNVSKFMQTANLQSGSVTSILRGDLREVERAMLELDIAVGKTQVATLLSLEESTP